MSDSSLVLVLSFPSSCAPSRHGLGGGGGGRERERELIFLPTVTLDLKNFLNVRAYGMELQDFFRNLSWKNSIVQFDVTMTTVFYRHFFQNMEKSLFKMKNNYFSFTFLFLLVLIAFHSILALS